MVGSVRKVRAKRGLSVDSQSKRMDLCKTESSVEGKEGRNWERGRVEVG